MKVNIEFDSFEEMEAFRTSGKKTRTKKEEADEAGAVTGNAPAPLQPPAGGAAPGFNPGGFAPPAGGAAPQGGAFPAIGAQTGPAPEVVALVTRISNRVDEAIKSGQPADQVLAWFRGQCGPEAANMTMDQIKGIALPKMAVPGLENIAKLMNA